MVSSRSTKYTQAIVAVLTELKHATNAELLERLHGQFPELSATTVHRATTRMANSGTITEAPADAQGSMRYDANIKPHDHFTCTSCGRIRDIDIVDDVLPTLTDALGGCRVTGRLLIHGSCEKCHVKLSKSQV
ncbi:transcriptional repressor [Candidatus Saccharibacteria bacterium]|nr:transcriptional repressor [Candidatus Saccharibacteria bacterium]